MDNNKLIKTAEILAITFIVLFIIQKFGSYALDTYLGMIFKYEDIIELNSGQKFWGTLSAIIDSITRIGIAIWLWIQARKENMNVWIWSVLGLLTSLTGAILFFIILICKSLKDKQ